NHRIKRATARAHQAHLWGPRAHDDWSWFLATGFREDKRAYVHGLRALPRLGGRGFTSLVYQDGHGESLRFSRFHSKRMATEDQQPGVWSFEASKGRYVLSGRVSASLQRMVGAAVTDPEGTERFIHHGGVADCTLELYKRGLGRKKLERTLTAKGSVAFQQGTRMPFEDVAFYV
ncbi:MAG: hypothetical protein R3185_03835, partial [Candidatus Thermoplasmatota archaeon]|nr:hypothetical protein [Candidatus Thermoplasmatota archaeon]